MQKLSVAEKELFQTWLQEAYSSRSRRNERYSLRSFARHLDMDASTISKLMSGERVPSKTMALKICKGLCSSASDLEKLKILEGNRQDEAFRLSMDAFSIISDWYHYAILVFTEIKAFQNDSKWIASELDITVTEAKNSVSRLLRLGLIEDQGDILVRTQSYLTNDQGLRTSEAKKQLQRQLISKALIAVDECPQESKDITSMTMSIDPKNIEKAKSLVAQFRKDICELLETGEKSQVYNLGIQLYPISKTNFNSREKK